MKQDQHKSIPKVDYYGTPTHHQLNSDVATDLLNRSIDDAYISQRLTN